MSVAARRLARALRRRAASQAGQLPPPVTQCDRPLLLHVYWTADRADGADRRALLTLAAAVKRAMLREVPSEERPRIVAEARQRLGLLV